MRKPILMLVAFVMLVSACAPTPSVEPTATALPLPTPTDRPTVAPVAAPVLNLTVPVVMPGTLIPNMIIGTPASQITTIPFSFDRIAYSRRGGLTGESLIVIINRDGTGERNGQPITVDQATLDDLHGQLDRMSFFTLRGQFTSPSATSDVFYYSVIVEGSAGSRQVDAQDGLVPPQLRQLFTTLEAIGAS